MTNKLPVVTLLVAEAVDTIAGWIDRVKDKLESETGRQVLRTTIVEKLRAGAVSRIKVIAAAEAGHQDADLALREFAAECISRRQEMPTELAAFVQKALLQPPVSYPSGRNLADTWMRDIGIAVLVQLTMDRWRLPKSRSHISKNPERLSACYLVGLALVRHGINLGERRVEKIFDGHVRLTERVSALLPLK